MQSALPVSVFTRQQDRRGAPVSCVAKISNEHKLLWSSLFSGHN